MSTRDPHEPSKHLHACSLPAISAYQVCETGPVMEEVANSKQTELKQREKYKVRIETVFLVLFLMTYGHLIQMLR